MNEQVARNVVLVRAIETADTDREILSDDDRMYASRSARELAQWQAAESGSPVTVDHFLQQRSEQVIKRLSERTASFSAFNKRRGATGMLAALPVVALVLGFMLDRVADPHRVDLLPAPLLGIIAWNLVIYVVLLAWMLVPGRATGWSSETWLRRLAVGPSRLPRRISHALAAGLSQFTLDWARLAGPLTRARLSRAMHLAAAMFAGGAVLSLYWRGLVTEYGAGWESTFLTASQVHALLSVLFAPATAAFGLPGFSEAEVAALHFASTPPAGNGARWVHLYAATIVLLVVIPRLAFAALAHWRASRLARHFPIDLKHPYFSTFAELAGVVPASVVRVLPYSFTIDEVRAKGLNQVAMTLYGERARVMLRPSCDYGEDPKESLADTRLDDSSVSATAILFSLAATPERETHGAFVDHLKRAGVAGLRVMVDESGYLDRIGEQPGANQRMTERVALWRQFCDYYGLSATLVNLAHPEKYPLP